MRPDGSKSDWTASELSRVAGLPLPTTHRLLRDLVKVGAVYQDRETKRFRIGLGLIEVGLSAWGALSLREVARPHLERLARDTEETVFLAVRDGPYGVFIDKIESPHGLRYVEPLGHRVPLHVGAAEKVILAFLQPEQQDEVIQNLEWIKKTERTVMDERVLRAQLEVIREQGYVVTFGEYNVGTFGIAAPILSAAGQVIGAVAVAGPESRASPPGRVEKLVVTVSEAAAAISAAGPHL